MEFKVLTLNCWGLFGVAKNRKERIVGIAEALANSNYDVVCLQEVWLGRDFDLIKNRAQDVLPYSHYFHSGVLGSGVCILSRHVIEQAFFHQWPVNGYIHKIHHGDWFGGKGVGLCQLRVNGFSINVYSAHLHAEYDSQCDEYQAHRVIQAFDTAQFINVTSGGADLVVLAGDLNTEPEDLAYKVILSVAGLKDAYHDGSSDQGATYENPTNSFTPVSNDIPGSRIDYIMYSSGSNLHIGVKDYQLPLPSTIPGKNFSYSDHEAVQATLQITLETQPAKANLESKISILEEGLAVCDEAFKRLLHQRYLYWVVTFLLFALFVVLLTCTPMAGTRVFYHLGKILITIAMFYTLVMATVWDKMERHALLAATLSMQLCLNKINAKNQTK